MIFSDFAWWQIFHIKKIVLRDIYIYTCCIYILYLCPTRLNLGNRLILNKIKARYCCIPPWMNQHSYHLMLPLDMLKYWCGLSLGPFNSRSLLKNPSCPYWYMDGYLSSVGPSSASTWKMQHQEWEELLTHFILNLLMA